MRFRIYFAPENPRGTGNRQTAQLLLQLTAHRSPFGFHFALALLHNAGAFGFGGGAGGGDDGGFLFLAIGDNLTGGGAGFFDNIRFFAAFGGKPFCLRRLSIAFSGGQTNFIITQTKMRDYFAYRRSAVSNRRLPAAAPATNGGANFTNAL